MSYGGRGNRHRWMYKMTGLPGWIRFGFSPGWADRSPTGLPPAAQWIMQTGQMDDFLSYLQTAQPVPPAQPPGTVPPPQPPGTAPPPQPPTQTIPGMMMPPEQEKQILEQQLKFLEEQIKNVRKRLAELE